MNETELVKFAQNKTLQINYPVSTTHGCHCRSFFCRRCPYLERPAAPRHVRIISACFPKPPSENAPLSRNFCSVSAKWLLSLLTLSFILLTYLLTYLAATGPFWLRCHSWDLEYHFSISHRVVLTTSQHFYSTDPSTVSNAVDHVLISWHHSKYTRYRCPFSKFTWSAAFAYHYWYKKH